MILSSANTLTIELTNGTLVSMILYSIIWTIIYVLHLRRTDYQSSDRIIWTITLLIPILGPILYIVMSGTPLQQNRNTAKQNRKAADAEAEAKLKKKLNTMTDSRS